MDTYFDPAMRDLVKPGVDGNIMIISALAPELLRRRVVVETTVAVSSADVVAASLLGCELSFPVAEIRRIYLNQSRTIVMASRAFYESDIFEMRTEQTASEFFASRAEPSVHLDAADESQMPAGEV